MTQQAVCQAEGTTDHFDRLAEAVVADAQRIADDEAERARLEADRARRKRVRPAKGTPRTTRQRKIVCQVDGCGYNLRGSRGQLVGKGMPTCPCGGAMWWADVVDILDALDPASDEYARIIDRMDARELRSYGLDSYVRRSTPRNTHQPKCDNDGCGRFIRRDAERCGGGHWQKWAIAAGLAENDGMPF